MPLAKNGTLTQEIRKRGRFTEVLARKVIIQLLLAIDLMHSKGIIHRDLKPDNILIIDRNDLSVCISDLGLSVHSSNDFDLSILCGSPGYIEPEILRGQPASFTSDVFSLGSLLFNMLTGSSLYKAMTFEATLCLNRDGDPHKLMERNIINQTKNCQNLIRMMTSPKAVRPTTHECLQHPWFSKEYKAIDEAMLINTN